MQTACCTAALCAQRGKWGLAGVAAAATLVEPHLGLPICVALAVWNRSARVSILASAGALLALCVVAGGWRETVEYAVTVLPLHARSELTSDAQISLSALLHAFNVSEQAALRAGAIAYIGGIGASVAIGKILSERFDDDAFLVAVPAAFAAIGGTFMHVTEVFAALPLALLLFRHDTRTRAILLVSIVLLSVPWYTVLDGGLRAAFPATAALVVFYEVWQLGGKRTASAFVCAAAACALLFFAPAFNAHAAHVLRAAAAAAAPLDPLYPQATWRAAVQGALSTGSAITWALRALTWAGLLLAAGAAISAATPGLQSRRFAR